MESGDGARARTAISPSSPGLTTHLPAFAVLREIAGFGIVRTTRGNHSRCHAPSSGRAGMCCENRGGVLMESGDGARVKTAIPSALGGIDPRFSLAFDPPASLGSDLARVEYPLPGLITVNRGGALMDLRITRKMKIIQFSENIDKLTSYFDKYLKTKQKDEESYIILFQLVMSLY